MMLRNASTYWLLAWMRLALMLAATRTIQAFSGFSFDKSSSTTNNIAATALSVSSNSFATTTAINIEEDSPRDLDSMNEWAINCGVQTADGVGVVVEPNNPSTYTPVPEFGVSTSQPLAYGQPVLMVPQEMILTGQKAREELGCQEAAESLFERLQTQDDLPHFYLVCKLLREVELGYESPWYPWLNALPRYFSNGSSMTHFCTDLLPPLVGNLVTKERVRFRQFFRALKQVECLDPKTRKDKDLAKWAFAIVYTRTLPSLDANSGDVQLVPVADMFNHGTEMEVEFQTDENGNCLVVATQDVAAGSPLRVSYGDPTNPSYLFARYGFLDESSPATFCKIMLDPTPELVTMGYDHSKMLFYKDTGDVSEEVWDVLLYHIVLADQPGDQQALYQAQLNGDFATKQALHAQYYGATVQALLSHVDTFLQELEYLTDMAAGRDLNTHPRLPLLQRHNAFVTDTFLRVRARLMEY